MTEKSDKTPRGDEMSTTHSIAILIAGAVAKVYLAKKITDWLLDDGNVHWLPDPNLPKDRFICSMCGMSLQEIETNRMYGGETRCKTHPNAPILTGTAKHRFRYHPKEQAK